ncbi:uncharacterized protein LOC144149927 isoform X5 [Haemaphysalis longicornis]
MSTGGLPQFASLFEMVSACGLCEMPTDIDVLDSSGPCDSILGSVLRQLEALVTGSTTAVSAKEGFEPPSNLAAVLAIGWLVAQHGVLETLLLGITSPVTCHTVAKARQWLPRDGQQQRALQAYLRWRHQDERLLWQALRRPCCVQQSVQQFREPGGIAESRWKEEPPVVPERPARHATRLGQQS